MFVLATRDGRTIDLGALWTAIEDAAAGDEDQAAETLFTSGALLGLRLALDEPTIARALLVDFAQEAGVELGIADEQIEIGIRELAGEVLAAAAIRGK